MYYFHWNPRRYHGAQDVAAVRSSSVVTALIACNVCFRVYFNLLNLTLPKLTIALSSLTSPYLSLSLVYLLTYLFWRWVLFVWGRSSASRDRDLLHHYWRYLHASHSTPTSSSWLQFLASHGLCRQLSMLVSFPSQSTLASQILPDPCPKYESNRNTDTFLNFYVTRT